MPLAPYLQPFVLRTVLPNTTGAYILRVDPFGAQRISIIAWQIEWYRVEQDRNPASPNYGRTPREMCWPVPILPEGDYGSISNAIDVLVDRDVWSDGTQQWLTEAEALTECRKQIESR